MCGIAGIIGTTDPDALQRVGRMTAILGHRGPDAGRVRAFTGAVLGHRRLSIIDLSDRGLQPMVGGDGRYALAFNGEIYNYRELRAELSDRWTFTSDGDSEVLLAALAIWGDAALERLNGMFAFCFYDTQTGRAFLARDRFGQKPLLYAVVDGQLLFASEAKSLLAAGIKAQPDHRAWARYLLHAYYDDGADTFFVGMSQLLPGDSLSFIPGQPPRTHRWYEIARRVQPRQVSRDEAAETVRALLVDAARLHMRADVPVGVSLSGGLDSSALLACLEQAGELRGNVRTASVDFGGDLSERHWIEAAADYHSLPTQILGFTPEDFHASIRPMTWHLEGPIGGLMNCALSPVMRWFRDNGISVVQDGTGLDEAFGGYRNHHNLYVGLAMRKGGAEAERAVADYCANWGVTSDQARRAGQAALVDSVTAIDGTVPVRPELLSPAFATEFGAPLAPEPTTGDPLRDALASYLQVQKIPRNTRMKDRLSMAYSLELRLPFLDHRLVEYGLSLPPDQMFLHGRTKSIIREALSGVMDDEVRLAAKRSIQAPQGLWLMKEPMRSYVRDLIESPSFAARGIFEPAKCQAAFDRFCNGADGNSFFVWQWINVEEWFRIFVDGDPVANHVSLYPGQDRAPTIVEDAA